MIRMATTTSEYPQISIEVSGPQSILNNISGRSYVVLKVSGRTGEGGVEGRKWGKQKKTERVNVLEQQKKYIMLTNENLEI